jgi:CDP-diacylglycerol---glycerol-3-phosphate 3-phosphatidyltransferase
MANLVTLLRLTICLGITLPATYADSVTAHLTAFTSLVVVFALDAVDGWVARRRGECDRFGASFDIAADRVIEIMLWIALADLGRVPIWVPMVFVVRGVLVDSARAVSVADGHEPFSLAFGRVGATIVAARHMRGLYGSVKLAALGWFLLAPTAPVWRGLNDLASTEFLEAIGATLYIAATVLCVLRGAPVLSEAFRRHVVRGGRHGEHVNACARRGAGRDRIMQNAEDRHIQAQR